MGVCKGFRGGVLYNGVLYNSIFMNRWSIIFKTLGSINRLKIVKLLSGGRQLSVSDIADDLKISQKAISKHLIMLHNLDVLHNVGKDGHVFYFLNVNMPKDFERAIKLLK